MVICVNEWNRKPPLVFVYKHKHMQWTYMYKQRELVLGLWLFSLFDFFFFFWKTFFSAIVLVVVLGLVIYSQVLNWTFSISFLAMGKNFLYFFHQWSKTDIEFKKEREIENYSLVGRLVCVCYHCSHRQRRRLQQQQQVNFFHLFNIITFLLFISVYFLFKVALSLSHYILLSDFWTRFFFWPKTIGEKP